MKRLFLFLLPLLLFASTLFAQKQGRALLDSLVSKAPYGTEDSNKALLYNKICEMYFQISADTGLKYGEQGLQIARDIDFKRGIAMLKNSIGKNYLSKDDHTKALIAFQEALKINEETGNRKEAAMNLGNIGNVHYRQKNYDKAFDYYLQAYNINKEQGIKDKMANNLGNMANVYSHYFDTSAEGSQLRTINRDKAFDYYNKSYEIYKELGDKGGMARNLGNAGNIWAFDDDKTKAVELYSEALKMYEDVGNKMAQAAFLINIENIYREIAEDTTGKLKAGQYTRANKIALLDIGVAYLNKAIALAAETGYLEAVRDGSGNLSNVYYLKGDYKKAFEFHKKYSDIVDSMNRQNNASEISKLESQYKLEKQDKEIEIKKLEVAKKRNTSFFLGAGMMLLLLVIIFIAKERKKSEQLLLNILPAKIAERLKKKEHPIADHFKGASVMFIDMADFTSFAADKDPKELVTILNEIFSRFDAIAEKHGLEKIKTIGDCYMAVSGLPQPRNDHGVAAANMALEVKELVKDFKTTDGTPVHFRIGLDCGPVVAGVIGTKKFIYDLWGDPVNTASRMETTGIIGEIHCTQNFKFAVQNQAYQLDDYEFTPRGVIEIKGKGKMQTWLLHTNRPLVATTVL
jgi:class 3 adenylate cyclase/tetratricopeptide (TPR) repeat protein